MLGIKLLDSDGSPFGQCIKYPVAKNLRFNMEYIKALARALKEIYPATSEHIDLICRGSSGAIIGALVLLELDLYPNLELVHVKKEGEVSHNSRVNIRKNSKLVFVDDFMATGDTVAECFEAVVISVATNFNKEDARSCIFDVILTATPDHCCPVQLVQKVFSGEIQPTHFTYT
jgi:adenine/guanine phosphoribosyltransferase-like PRPP-binding protein